jgi:hypothetical protein
VKSKKKPPKRRAAASKKSKFGPKVVRARSYRRLKLRNDRGEREDVLLFDSQSMEAEQSFLVQEDQAELRLDLTRALRMFTLQERRVLYRVLVQRQSMTQATKQMRKHSGRWWRRWMQDKALPKLRAKLGDYCQNGKVVL